MVSRFHTTSILIAAVFLVNSWTHADSRFVRGDIDPSDSAINLSDPVHLLFHLFTGNPENLSCEDAGDVNDDGTLDISDSIYLLRYLFLGDASPRNPFPGCGEDLTVDALDCETYLSCPDPAPPSLSSTSPVNGELGVALTRETILYFEEPLDPLSIPNRADSNDAAVYAQQGGEILPARVHLSSDGLVLTLFYDENLPDNSQIRLTIDGDQLPTESGVLIDADNDGEAGGTHSVDFTTVTITTIEGTSVIGRVFASELAETPDGEPINTPLEGVIITVDGREDTLRTVTDENGNFKLDPAPVGRFFVHVDGREITGNFPEGEYYPFVGKPFYSVAGRESNIGDIYLPLVSGGSLQEVSEVDDTDIPFPAEVMADRPEFVGTSITVPAGSLFANDGTPGGRVGIAPVDPSRLPGGLPPGLEPVIVITVQTDGATNFDVPAPVCFPNLPDPTTGETLAPGEVESLLSFNHDSGRWEAVGTMVVSEDGQLICTEPGSGILAPGWHANTPEPESPPKFRPRPAPRPSQSQCDSTENLLCVLSCTGEFFNENLNVLLDFYNGFIKKLCRGNAYICLANAFAYSAYQQSKLLQKLEECDTLCTRSTGCAGLGEGGGANADLDSTLKAIIEITEQARELMNPFVLTLQDIPPEVQTQVDELFLQADDLAGGDIISFLENRIHNNERDLAQIDNQWGPAYGTAPAHPIMYAVRMQRGDDEFIVRGETFAHGQYTVFVPRNGSIKSVNFYDPIEQEWGVVYPRLTDNDDSYRLPNVALLPLEDDLPDFDLDGLPDVVEFVYGTNANNPDTDDDGLNDGTEVKQGSNPLDGILAANEIISTADTPGLAVDVCVADGLVAVADSEAGVSVFNVFGGMNPAIIAQVDTPGIARAVGMANNKVVVADGDEGVAIIDLKDPAEARIVNQIPISDLGGSLVQAVTTIDQVAYVGTEAGVIGAIDLNSNQLFDMIDLNLFRAGIEDLAIEGNILYAYSEGDLTTLSIGNEMSVIGTGESPGMINFVSERGRLVVGAGIAYTVDREGYNTVGVGHPDYPGTLEEPTLLDSEQSGFFGWKDLALNGTGLGVAAVSEGSGPLSAHDVSIYDTSDPEQVTLFMYTIETPGTAYAVCINEALAYIADGENGLQVINYFENDLLSTPPEVTLRTGSGETEIVEGQRFTVIASVEDDVQVRQVEFYLDDERIARDGEYPFEVRLNAGLISESPTMTLEARATDTGGNISSRELEITLIEDSTSPTVQSVTPSQDSIQAINQVKQISMVFDEPIDSESLESALKVYGEGPDGELGTADDILFEGDSLYSPERTNLSVLAFSEPLPEGQYLAVIEVTATDLAENSLDQEFSWTFEVFQTDISNGEVFHGEGELTSMAPHGFSFTADAGQTVFFEERTPCCDANWRCYDEDGVEVFAKNNLDVLQVGLRTLERGGRYTIEIMGSGEYAFSIWTVPPTSEYEIAIGDVVSDNTPGEGAGIIAIPGEQDTYKFTANPGERVYFDEQSGCCPANWSCVDEDGGVVFQSNSIFETLDVGAVTLDRGGVYTITVTGSGNKVGSYGFQILTVPEAEEFQISIGDTISAGQPMAGAGNIESPGAADIYTFTATAGQTVFFDEEAACCGLEWNCVDEDGTEIFNFNFLFTVNPIGARTLERGGEYTITVRGRGAGTGTYGFEIRDGGE